VNTVLAGVNAIPGVLGSAIFDGNDHCVAAVMPHPYDVGLLTQVMGELRNTLQVLTYLEYGDNWSGLVARFDAGYLIVRNVAGMTVLVLTQPSLNLAMLSVGFNVAALKLQKMAMAQAQAQQPVYGGPSQQMYAQPDPNQSAPPLQPMQQGGQRLTLPLPAPPVHQQPPPRISAEMAAVSPSQLSQSGRLTSTGTNPGNPMSQSGSREFTSPGSNPGGRLASSSTGISGLTYSGGQSDMPVPDPIGPQIMDGLLKALARHIGPFAKMILKEELTKLGVSASTIQFAQYEDFVGSLARRVQDPAKRREFVAECEKIQQKR
jgi:hypothetical protein